jgi:hypothetical protein
MLKNWAFFFLLEAEQDHNKSLDSAIPASGCRLLIFDVAVLYSYLYLTGRYIGSNQNR